MAANEHPRNKFLRRSLWRNRTTPGRRAAAVATTFVVIVSFGAMIMSGVLWGLSRLGAPGWVVLLPWLAPTVGVVAWALARPAAAVLSDDDDDGWTGYSIRAVMIGSDVARRRPVRAIAALLFGAPLAWAIGVLLLVELTGIF